jgi:uncharacterized membrane protein YqjE
VIGLGRSLGQLGAASLQLARQRLESAALEVEEELLRFAGTLAALLAAVLLGTLALAGFAATLVAWLWDTARIAALLGVSLAFAASAGAIAWRVARARRDKPPFLSATLAELRRDAEALGGAR